MTMSRDEARILISDLIEWYTEDLGERLGLSMCKETYMDALEVLWHGPDGDLISRADAIDAVAQQWLLEASAESPYVSDDDIDDYRKLAEELLSDIPSAEAVQGWIPCSERLPEDLEAVNVTWVNHNPPVYYQYTKDVPNADTAVYYRGTWYWWDATVIDLLGEYGGAYIHGIEPIDKDIEVTAWMPLPTPYKGGDTE